MTQLLAPYNLPFAIALAVLVLLLLSQMLGLSALLGDSDADHSLGHDGADVSGGLASLLGLGKLPLIVWFSTFLASFALIGISVQELASDLLGSPLSPGLGALVAGALALPINSAVVAMLARIWPHDETTAVELSDLVGRRGQIEIGQSRRDHPARLAVADQFGHMHHVMVEPHEDTACFEQGDEVLLVRVEGQVFYAVGTSGPFRIGV